MNQTFADRAEAGVLLARECGPAAAGRPVVLAIPRGGVEVGATLAAAIDADFDVVLSRKLRAPHQPELAIGAVSEDGAVHLVAGWDRVPGVTSAWIEAERAVQLEEMARRRSLIRAVRPAVPLAGRHVIVTDDGIATGATMIAALRTVRGSGAASVTVAVPVAPPDRLTEIRPLCDRLVCLLAPDSFSAVGQFYRAFDQVDDDRVVDLLRGAGGARGESGPSSPS
jgi:predicted phosphoribosyltransferase